MLFLNLVLVGEDELLLELLLEEGELCLKQLVIAVLGRELKG